MIMEILKKSKLGKWNCRYINRFQLHVSKNTVVETVVFNQHC